MRISVRFLSSLGFLPFVLFPRLRHRPSEVAACPFPPLEMKTHRVPVGHERKRSGAIASEAQRTLALARAKVPARARKLNVATKPNPAPFFCGLEIRVVRRRGKPQFNFETKTGEVAACPFPPLETKTGEVAACPAGRSPAGFARLSANRGSTAFIGLPTPQLVRRYRENEVFAVRERRDAAHSPRSGRKKKSAAHHFPLLSL